MSAEKSTPAATSEANHTTSEAPPASAEQSVDDLTPTEATSEANKAAVSIDEPALPPASPSDDNKFAGKEVDLDMKATGTAVGAVFGATVVAPEGDEILPSAKKGRDTKRRSSAGIPEHKGKKLNKKKSMPILQLNAKPGDYYWARMKGYPPWPSIVCDEDMLPESLLQTRPVTAMRTDGSYRDDFLEGGKNARDRTYAVMYLGTNEFSWMPNSDLKPLDFEEVDKAEQGKKTKQLWSAYELARERHELQHFKDLLAQHEEAVREENEEMEKRDAEKAAKLEKKAAKEKRKSKAAESGAEDEDVEMPDADTAGEPSAKKAKPSKKRKKEAESDGDGAKPAKTPKTKLKVNLSKSADGETPTPKSKSKPKAAKAVKESPKPPQMTEAEKRQKREKEVLYFRHKLQKGFLSTDSPPKEAEMKQMGEHFTQLEGLGELEQSVIRNTKIHKVLKAIIKLGSIPKDEEYNFKQRSMDLLQKWQKILAENADGADGEVETGKTNGEAAEAEKSEGEAATSAGGKDETAKTEPAEDTKDDAANGAAEEAADGDAAIPDSKPDAPDAAYVPPTDDAVAAEADVTAEASDAE